MDDVGCARPTGGPVGQPEDAAPSDPTESHPTEQQSMIKVGQKAPDFTAPTYHNGKFGSVTLSDHLGRWVMLCFYPGDYTFV